MKQLFLETKRKSKSERIFQQLLNYPNALVHADIAEAEEELDINIQLISQVGAKEVIKVQKKNKESRSDKIFSEMLTTEESETP
uniref:Uncharacterized protein n=1 Tax=Arion vulgaris TaxID=1028688 RepID=A0A0B6ZSG5_9EUPU